MRHLFVLLIVTIRFHAFADASESTDEKARSTAQLLSIAAQLGEVASAQTKHYPEPPVTQRIDALVEQMRVSEDLVRLALLCHAVQGSGMAEHASYNGVFDYAMWRCAHRLSQLPGLEGESALVRLQPVIGRDGGDSLRMRELIASQKKLTTTLPE